MIFWTLQITIISIIFIFLIHHLINFFKSTLTIPKIKDLVNSPAQKYENIYKTINSATTATIIDATDTTNATNITDITDIISSRESSLKNSSNVMKNELKKFLKSQITPPIVSYNSKDTNISVLDSGTNNNTFNSFDFSRNNEVYSTL
jgi:hypothetical protein